MLVLKNVVRQKVASCDAIQAERADYKESASHWQPRWSNSPVESGPQNSDFASPRLEIFSTVLSIANA